MPRKAKIAFVVSSELFVRNYFRTGALRRLEQDHDITFLVSDTITSQETIADGGRRRVVVYPSDAENRKRQFKTYKVLMQRFRNRSSTIRFRLDRMHAPKRAFRHPALSHPGQNLRALIERVGLVYRRMRLRVMASWPVYSVIHRNRIAGLVPAQGIAAALAGAEADLIVMPSSAFDPEGNDVIRQADILGVPTLFLIDNWDNLSSKSVMLLKPDHLAVWGEQSRNHARDIQEFDPQEVTILGTPRFDQYFRLRDGDLPGPFDFPYILFLGTSLAFDEASALENLEAVLNRHPERFEGVRIVYRPHPWREGTDTIEGRGLSRVVIDPQMAGNYLRDGAQGLSFQPDLAYYPGLLNNAEVVVGGLTSMLIEATIFGKSYIALTYDDGIHVTNQRTVFERSEHFRGIERIPSLRICEVEADAERFLLDAWDRRGALDRAAIDTGRQYILFDDGRPYADRLADLVAARVAAIPARD